MKYLRRVVWFVASRLFLGTVVAGLCVVVFYYAMNLANIQVVLKDGLAKRAQVILMDENPAELTKYFQTAYLERDTALIASEQGLSPYENYTIRGIDHRMEMGFTWVWPWEETARVDLVERIPRIDGRVKGSKAEEVIAQQGESAVYPPAWQSARYRAVLVKESGQWHIKSMSMLEKLE